MDSQSPVEGIKRDLDEHLTQKQIEDYCRQTLSVAELLSVSDHLNECEACRLHIESATDGDAVFFALRTEIFGKAAATSSQRAIRAHLTPEQTAGYVDRNLAGDELQTVADHLTHCEQCALAVDDLNAFKNQIAPSLDHEYYPATLPSPTEGFWRGTFASLIVPFRRYPGLAFGSVMAILLLAAIGWLIWRTPQQGEPEQEVVVTPPPAPQPATVPLIAQLNDGGGQLTLDREGRLSGANDLPIAYQNMLRDALTARRIERSSQLKGLARPPSSLMSTQRRKSEFSLIDPVAKVLMTNRPTFRWSPMEGATVYVVEVYDSEFNLVATSPPLTEHLWTASALTRGRVYGWQVKATKDGQEFTSPSPPAPQAQFRILGRTKANELAKARRAYPSSHLTLGLLYAEAGLLKEAEEELRALQKANPDSEIARNLLNQVQSLRR